jgi:hypothetical protein
MEYLVVVEPKPFHESILGIIEKAGLLDLGLIGNIIIATKVPKGHDEIIAAWQARTRSAHASERVTTSLLAQKATLTAKDLTGEEVQG